MCGRQIPVRDMRRLVDVGAVVNHQRHLPELFSKFQVRRCGENRVPTQDHQHFDLAGIHRPRECRE